MADDEAGVLSLDALVPKLMAADPKDVPALLDRVLVSDEQRAFITAGAWSRVLMGKAPFKATLGAMIAARQLYALAYVELQKLLAAEKPEPHPMTEDLLVQSAMHEAAKPFDQNAVIAAFVGSVMPWLADVADAANAADAAQAMGDMEQLDRERRATALDVGFRVDPAWAEPHLPRDRSLVLAGWRPAVWYVIDQIVNRVLAAKHDGFLATVVRLQQDHPRRGEEELRLLRLGKKKWEGCCNSANALARIAAEYLAPQMSHPADLVVCDDLTAAVTNAYAGKPAGAVAGDAHKRLRTWANRDGAAVVAGVPIPLTPTAVPDLSGPEWEQARTFATLRPVVVEEHGEDVYRIRVGNSAHHWDVPRTSLDSYAGSNLIVPGGL